MPSRKNSRPARRGAQELRPADDLQPADEPRPAPELQPAPDLRPARDGPSPSAPMRAGLAARAGARPAAPRAPAFAAAANAFAGGQDVLDLARRHIGEPYVLGARAPMANAGWQGPWDCAEFVSWCVYQASGVLFGTQPRNDPIRADAYTGYWFEQALAEDCAVAVEQAANIAGAVIVRRPGSSGIGHIVISDGAGGTVEAHSRLRGVTVDQIAGRRWDCGILVPGLAYLQSDRPLALPPAPPTLRLTSPLTAGALVRAVQEALRRKGLPVGAVDGVYGPQTAHAVRQFQAGLGLVADGEAGPATLDALGLVGAGAS